jgi:hypothetical protein
LEEGKNPLGQFSKHFLSFRLSNPVQEVHPESPAWSQVKQDDSHPRHSLEEGKNPFGQFSIHYLFKRLSNPVQDVHPESPARSQVKQDE